MSEDLVSRTRDVIDSLNPSLRDHVLIKGWHDQGGVEAVYGPYTKPQAEWLLTELLENSTYNWTLVKLSAYRGPS